MRAASAIAQPLPLHAYRHRAHRKGGKRQLIILWVALVIAAFFYGALFTFLPLSFIPMLTVPLLVLAAAVVWALPTAKKVPTKLLSSLFAGFFVALIVWPNYIAIAIPGLPWITFLRLLGFPLAAILLVVLSTSPRVRAEMKEVVVSAPWITRFLALFILIQFLTIATSDSPFKSLSDVAIYQVNWTAIFFISCYLFRSRKQMLRWAALLILMAIFVVGIGIWEWRLNHVPWADHIPSFLAIDDDTVQRILTGATRLGMNYRAQSTFTTSLSFAEYLALTTPFLIHLAVEARRQWLRFAAMACVPLIFFGIITTNARLGAIGFFLSFLLYLVIWAIRRWQRNPNSLFGPAITLAYPAILGMVVLASLVSLRIYRMVWGGGQYQYSTDARRQQIEMGIPKILHWPFGYGAGQSGDTLQFYSPSGLLTVDCYYLTIALDYGILGFIAFYGMFLAGIKYGGVALFRSRSYETSFLIPAVIALANFLIIKSVLSQSANNPLAFMLLGLVAALVYKVSKEQAALPVPIR